MVPERMKDGGDVDESTQKFVISSGRILDDEDVDVPDDGDDRQDDHEVDQHRVLDNDVQEAEVIIEGSKNTWKSTCT